MAIDLLSSKIKVWGTILSDWMVSRQAEYCSESHLSTKTWSRNFIFLPPLPGSSISQMVSCNHSGNPLALSCLPSSWGWSADHCLLVEPSYSACMLKKEKPASRSFCPCGAEVHHPSDTWMCSPTWKLSTSGTFGLFIEALSHRNDQSLTKFSVTFPLLESMGGMGLKVPVF